MADTARRESTHKEMETPLGRGREMRNIGLGHPINLPLDEIATPVSLS